MAKAQSFARGPDQKRSRSVQLSRHDDLQPFVLVCRLVVSKPFPQNGAVSTGRDLIAVHVSRAASVPVEIRLPEDTRALRTATLILETLSEAPSLQAVCREAGLSTRTMQRLFRAEVGSDAYSWRHQVRLTRALEHLLGAVRLSRPRLLLATVSQAPSSLHSAAPMALHQGYGWRMLAGLRSLQTPLTPVSRPSRSKIKSAGSKLSPVRLHVPKAGARFVLLGGM